MTRSEMIDNGYDFDYQETINQGYEYLWEYEEEGNEDDDDNW